MNVACISLSDEGAAITHKLCEQLTQPDITAVDLYVHEKVAVKWKGERFSRVIDLTNNIFSRYRGLIYCAPCGVVVRAIAPCIKHKITDPAIVAMDTMARYAISLLSGHEGGANNLAIRVANILGAEPVVTTSSEALKRLIIGIGCRRNTPAESIIAAIRDALSRIGADIDDVRLIATSDIKANEDGLLSAAELLDIPLRIISSEEIKQTILPFTRSSFVEKKVGLPAVAEPAALLAGRRTRLRLPKTAYQGITVAIAEENYLLSV